MRSRVNARFEHTYLAFENYCVKVNRDRPIPSTTLDDLERLIRTSDLNYFFNFGALSNFLHYITIAESCSSGTLVSDNIKIMWVFAGVL